MFFVLLTIFFMTDGPKQVTAEVVNSPIASVCEAKANKYAQDFQGHTAKEILGVGFSCDGPYDDPSVRKLKS
jgi:hypothetical protein